MNSTRSDADAAQSGVVRLLPALALLLALLILVQALLAGEWLAGKDVIKVHQANGIVILVLALLYTGLVAGVVRGASRAAAIGLAALFALMVLVQLLLGFGGFDSANQARALHIVNGLIVFGLAGENFNLARRIAGGR